MAGVKRVVGLFLVVGLWLGVGLPVIAETYLANPDGLSEAPIVQWYDDSGGTVSTSTDRKAGSVSIRFDKNSQSTTAVSVIKRLNAGWYQPGIDLFDYDTLDFWLKVDTSDPVWNLTVGIRDNYGPRNFHRVQAGINGSVPWTHYSVALSDMTMGEGADITNVMDIIMYFEDLNAQGNATAATIYIDEVHFTNFATDAYIEAEELGGVPLYRMTGWDGSWVRLASLNPGDGGLYGTSRDDCVIVQGGYTATTLSRKMSLDPGTYDVSVRVYQDGNLADDRAAGNTIGRRDIVVTATGSTSVTRRVPLLEGSPGWMWAYVGRVSVTGDLTLTIAHPASGAAALVDALEVTEVVDGGCFEAEDFNGVLDDRVHNFWNREGFGGASGAMVAHAGNWYNAAVMDKVIGVVPGTYRVSVLAWQDGTPRSFTVNLYDGSNLEVTSVIADGTLTGGLIWEDVGTLEVGALLRIEVDHFDAPQSNDSFVDVFCIEKLRPPVAVCKAAELPMEANCCAQVLATDVDNGSYDPEGQDVSLSVAPTQVCGAGDHTVTLTVTDEDGLRASCQATVTVAVDADLLCETIGAAVDASVPAGGSYGNHGDYVSQVAHATNAAMAALVPPCLTEEVYEEIHSCVVSARARSRIGIPEKSNRP